MLAKGTNKMIILLIGSPMNRLKNFTLSYNEISTAKTDHKNEISTKNWVGSTWVAKVNSGKSQLCWSKSTQKVNSGQRKSQRLVNAKSQLWSTEKSTVNSGQSQRSTLGLTWHCADVAVAV
jgi:hypothetical protein